MERNTEGLRGLTEMHREKKEKIGWFNGLPEGERDEAGDFV